MQPTVETMLKELLAAIGLSYSKIDVVEIAGQKVYSIEAGEAGRALIGSHGDTVHAIDHLVKKILEKHMPHKPLEEGELREPLFLIDVNGYRSQKIKDLQTKALMMAERARSFQYDVELSPMSAYERLIVHTTLQEAPHVKTESQGEGRNRRVVIRYVASE
jgi:spoIIIJ-associated protein